NSIDVNSIDVNSIDVNSIDGKICSKNYKSNSINKKRKNVFYSTYSDFRKDQLKIRKLNSANISENKEETLTSFNCDATFTVDDMCSNGEIGSNNSDSSDNDTLIQNKEIYVNIDPYEKNEHKHTQKDIAVKRTNTFYDYYVEHLHINKEDDFFFKHLKKKKNMYTDKANVLDDFFNDNKKTDTFLFECIIIKESSHIYSTTNSKCDSCKRRNKTYTRRKIKKIYFKSSDQSVNMYFVPVPKTIQLFCNYRECMYNDIFKQTLYYNRLMQPTEQNGERNDVVSVRSLSRTVSLNNSLSLNNTLRGRKRLLTKNLVQLFDQTIELSKKKKKFTKKIHNTQSKDSFYETNNLSNCCGDNGYVLNSLNCDSNDNNNNNNNNNN
ncbi:hypothetical protein HEP_00491900, partial [Hepatocystis sp. ex Piliocolobus tephrosceles]